MTEYIDREAVIKARRNCNRNCENCDFAIEGDSWCNGEVWVVDILRIPSADVRPVVRGKWELREKLQYASIHTCSCCGYLVAAMTNYCPKCGADMRGKNNG